MTNNIDSLKIDELTDKLIEKREKLLYFIITACTGIMVFTFNSLNNPDGFLHHSPRWPIMLGWGTLIISSVISLYLLHIRQDLYWLNLKIRYEKREEPSEGEIKDIKKTHNKMKILQVIIILSFIIGVIFFATAYTIALVDQQKTSKKGANMFHGKIVKTEVYLEAGTFKIVFENTKNGQTFSLQGSLKLFHELEKKATVKEIDNFANAIIKNFNDIFK
jgi:hypothetical protein